MCWRPSCGASRTRPPIRSSDRPDSVPSPGEDTKNPAPRAVPETQNSPLAGHDCIAHDINIACEQGLDLCQRYAMPKAFEQVAAVPVEAPELHTPFDTLLHMQNSSSAAKPNSLCGRARDVLQTTLSAAQTFARDDLCRRPARGQRLERVSAVEQSSFFPSLTRNRGKQKSSALSWQKGKSVLYHWQSRDRTRPLTGFQRGENKRRRN